MVKYYGWNTINDLLYKGLGISPKIILKIKSNLPRKRKMFSKNEVALAYAMVYNKSMASHSNMLSKLRRVGMK